MRIISALLTALCLYATPAPAQSLDAYARSVVHQGSTADYLQLTRKLRLRRPVTIVCYGESITYGAQAWPPETNGFVPLLAQWMGTQYPGVRIINAGVGGDTSGRALARYDTDVRPYRADLIVLEFSVNDFLRPTEDKLRDMVLTILADYPRRSRPAILLLEVCGISGESAQQSHLAVAEEFGLTMISLHDALWPQVEAGEVALSSIFYNEWHPGNAGHQYLADLLTHHLGAMLLPVRPYRHDRVLTTR